MSVSFGNLSISLPRSWLLEPLDIGDALVADRALLDLDQLDLGLRLAADNAGNQVLPDDDLVAVDVDLERILDLDAERLPDLHRDHDATEVVNVTDDALAAARCHREDDFVAIEGDLERLLGAELEGPTQLHGDDDPSEFVDQTNDAGVLQLDHAPNWFGVRVFGQTVEPKLGPNGPYLCSTTSKQ